jgi:CHAD domain-containing protein
VHQLRTELKWIAGELGRLRDLEVLRARVDAQVEALPAEQVLGPVRSRLDIRLAAEAGDARRAGVAALDSERYRELVNRLVAFVARPPVTGRASKRADKILKPLALWEHERLAKLMKAAGRCEPGSERDAAVHALRKQTKRARYAAEAVQPVLGKAARRYVKAAEGLQELLGERQDAVVAGRVLWEEGRRAGVAPHENGYTFGLLAGREAASIKLCDDALPAAWRRLDRRKRTRWMS